MVSIVASSDRDRPERVASGVGVCRLAWAAPHPRASSRISVLRPARRRMPRRFYGWWSAQGSPGSGGEAGMPLGTLALRLPEGIYMAGPDCTIAVSCC
jgi:hypothetical protein